ncbi:MAG: hypothetical protein AB7U20_06680 [Planctomycetaceae bacterium]
MDRTRFLPTALIAGLMGAAQLGCQGDTGEYRTVTQAETAGAVVESAETQIGTSVDQQSLRASTDGLTKSRAGTDAAMARGEAALPGDSGPAVPSEAPMEPELVPDGDAAADGEKLLAVAGVADDAVPRAVRAEADSPPSSRIGPQEATASRVPVGPDGVDGASPGFLADLSQAPIEHREIKLLVPEKTFNTEGPANALRVSYDDLDLLKVLNMEPVPEDAVSHFPGWLSGLDGQRVRIRGFMYPTFQESGLSGFVLARDNQICCFGRNPKIYDLVEVSMRDGVTTDYIQGRPFDVAGVFHIRPDSDQGELYELYQIDDAVVIDK